MRTQVGIIGAGPAGLLLGHLLHRSGIDTVIIEQKSRTYCEQRIRAGVLEQGTVDLLVGAGVGERLKRLAMPHHGIDLRFDRQPHMIDIVKHSGGRRVTVYAQHEIVIDLIAARVANDLPILFECNGVRIVDAMAEPRIAFRHNGVDETLACDFIAGCDGFHGPSRDAIPADVLRVASLTYPYAWLGVLAEAPPASPDVVYAHHEDGFALQSMRSPQVSRLYVQCPPDDEAEDWSDDRFWATFHRRIDTRDGWRQPEGPIFQKGVTGMRSVIVEPMRWQKLFLLGDAAHIVPPTGAKGLNLAAGDACVLDTALSAFYHQGRHDLIDTYSERCLRRAWSVQRFASGLCNVLHTIPEKSAFAQRLQLEELRYLAETDAGARVFSENYTGLPLGDFERPPAQPHPRAA